MLFDDEWPLWVWAMICLGAVAFAIWASVMGARQQHGARVEAGEEKANDDTSASATLKSLIGNLNYPVTFLILMLAMSANTAITSCAAYHWPAPDVAEEATDGAAPDGR